MTPLQQRREEFYNTRLKKSFEEYKEKRTQNKRALEKIIKENINNFTDNDRKILLLLAISNGSTESVKLLLEKDLSEKKLDINYSMNLLEVTEKLTDLLERIPAEDPDVIIQQFYSLQEGVIAIQTPPGLRVIIDELRQHSTTLSPTWLLDLDTYFLLQKYLLKPLCDAMLKNNVISKNDLALSMNILFEKIEEEHENIPKELNKILDYKDNMKATKKQPFPCITNTITHIYQIKEKCRNLRLPKLLLGKEATKPDAQSNVNKIVGIKQPNYSEITPLTPCIIKDPSKILHNLKPPQPVPHTGHTHPNNNQMKPQ